MLRKQRPEQLKECDTEVLKCVQGTIIRAANEKVFEISALGTITS